METDQTELTCRAHGQMQRRFVGAMHAFCYDQPLIVGGRLLAVSSGEWVTYREQWNRR